MTVSAQICLWCDRPATHLCDAVIVQGRSAKGLQSYTCDAPMCAHHAKQFGFICIRGKGRKADSLDRCPWHMDHQEEAVHEMPVAITDEDVATRRREVHALIRRERMRADA